MHNVTDKQTRPERRAAARASRSPRRMRHAFFLIWLTAVLLGLIVLAGALTAHVAQQPSAGGLTTPSALNPANVAPPVGSVAPNFTLNASDGTPYVLSNLRGKVVVLEFFAVWCPVCQHEAPDLHDLDAAYAGKGVQTLAVLANPYGRNYETSSGTDTRLADKSDLSWYTQTFAVSHPTLIDPTFATVNRYSITGYPAIYVVDPAGTIRYHNVGYVPYATLAQQVDAALHQTSH